MTCQLAVKTDYRNDGSVRDCPHYSRSQGVPCFSITFEVCFNFNICVNNEISPC